MIISLETAVLSSHVLFAFGTGARCLFFPGRVMKSNGVDTNEQELKRNRFHAMLKLWIEISGVLPKKKRRNENLIQNNI